MDHLLFWNAEDLERKLKLYQMYYHGWHTLQGLEGDTPEEKAGSPTPQPADLGGIAAWICLLERLDSPNTKAGTS